jgi:PST family polysaccharide transporter
VLTLKTYGALISLIVPPAVLVVFAFYQINRVIDFKNYLSFHWVDLRLVKNMSPYALMTLVSAVGGSWVYLMIRQNLIHASGIEQAGYWEAISRISSYYLLFISTVLSVYFFPKLSAATSPLATKNIFMSYFKGIMPLFLGGLFLVYAFRNLLVTICFSTDFTAVNDLFIGQLLGDFFKAASLILGYQFLAKQLTSAYILTEVFSLVLLASLSYYWAPIYGAKGVVMAYAADYFIYFLLLVFYFRKTLFSAKF